MKRVLIFHPTIAPYRVDFFNDLYDEFNTNICLFFKNFKGQLFKYEDIEKQFIFKPDYFDKSIKLLNREIQVGFVKRLKKFNPDIVIVNEFSESFYVVFMYKILARKSYKIISICDDSLDIINFEKGLHSLSRRVAMRNVDGLILCNHAAENFYNNRYPNVKTVVMPIIQNESSFYLNIGEVRLKGFDIAKKWGLFGKRVFLFVGRISTEKNIEYLIKSFICGHDNNPDNVLFIIGDSLNKEYSDNINKLIDENKARKYIVRIGRKEGMELKAWYHVSQVLVLPSTREAFGAVVNEALLMGDYVMVSNVAGSADLINPSNGELIDILKEKIDFSRVNSVIPLLSESYLNNKNNKMKCSYKECMNRLIDWM